MTNVYITIEQLKKLRDFLAKYEDGYADVLDKFQKRFLNAISKNASDKEIELIYNELTPYVLGGMGSLTDVVICKRNRHPVKKEEEDEVNYNYQILLEELSKSIRERNSGI
jgi:hypothetical protein